MISSPAGDSNRPGLSEIIAAYKIPFLLGIASILCIFFSILLIVRTAQNTSPIEFSSIAGEATASAAVHNITVDIQGSVFRPGVYELPLGARVEDALKAAGGLTDDADEEFLAKSINRAQKVSDGAKLYIASREDTTTSHINGVIIQGSLTSYNNNEGANGSAISGLISINTASQSELESLPGVGPVTAGKIISNRPYGSVDELLSRKVIGPSLFEKIKNSLNI